MIWGSIYSLVGLLETQFTKALSVLLVGCITKLSAQKAASTIQLIPRLKSPEQVVLLGDLIAFSPPFSFLEKTLPNTDFMQVGPLVAPMSF